MRIIPKHVQSIDSVFNLSRVELQGTESFAVRLLPKHPAGHATNIADFDHIDTTHSEAELAGLQFWAFPYNTRMVLNARAEIML